MDLSRRTVLRSLAIGSAVAGTGMLAACGSTGSAQSSGSPTGTPGPAPSFTIDPNEVVPLQLFASPGFNGQGLFALGGASSHTAEVGEVLRIAQSINAASGNPADPAVAAFDAYFEQFGAFGDLLAKSAEDSGDRHPVTTRDRRLRAAGYSAQQLFFVLGTSNGAREEQAFDTTQSRWLAAVESFSPRPERATVTSAFGDLPIYLFRPPGREGSLPTVIISEGSDGQNVETMQFGVTAGLARGYNVVLFEGPGQMSLLFKRGIPFTPNWDQVVGPVLEWVKAQPGVAKVGLIGISFGGMLCSRAAARLPGLAAVVLEPGAWSMPNLWADQKTIQTVQQTQNLPEAEKTKVQQEVNSGFVADWPNMSRMEQFTVYKRGEIFSTQVMQDARAGQPPSDYYGLIEAILPFNFQADFEAITIPTMITANEGDEFFAGQSAEAYAMLEKVPAADKVLVQFTAAQGAALHDQPTGPQVANEYVFDWLDDRLG